MQATIEQAQEWAYEDALAQVSTEDGRHWVYHADPDGDDGKAEWRWYRAWCQSRKVLCCDETWKAYEDAYHRAIVSACEAAQARWSHAELEDEEDWRKAAIEAVDALVHQRKAS